MKQDEILPGENPGALNALFEPRSVAIIGASDDAARIGGRPIRYLRQAGYSGAIYPVNPNRDTVQGLPAFKSISTIPHAVDLAILALPSEQVVEAVAACAEKGVKAVIVFSSGFAETDEEGAGRQNAIRQIARQSGMRVLGPNCLGAFNSATGFFGTFTQAFDDGVLPPGPISIASQSGACGGHLGYLCKQRGIGIQYWITTGNEADVDIAECILWMASSPHVKVIVVYAEAIRDGATFIRALETARRHRKPVVMLKVGRSDSGARAAASHTGALAGQDAVYDAILRQYGVFRADSIEQMLDIAVACAHGVFPPNRRLGIVTVSGGLGVQMSDAAEACGLEVGLLPVEAQARIKTMLPFAAVANPIDVTAQAINDLTVIDRCLEIALTDGDYGAIVCFLTSAPAASSMTEPLLQAFTDVHRRFPERLIVLSFAAPSAVVRRFEQAGFLVYEDVNRAVKAIAALASFAETFASSLPAPGSPSPAGTEQSTRSALRVTAADLASLNEHVAKNLLAAAGIPALPERVIRDADQARLAAAELGCPVALKILSPDIAHKTEIGGVVLNLPTPDAAASAAMALLDRVASQRPEARLTGVLVAPMCTGGIETICGVFRDPVFGPMVMFGLGGVYVEVLKDVAFRLAPFNEDEALSMVREIRGYAILEGTRGSPPADMGALTRALSALSRFAATNRDTIAEIDINPFVVMPQGQGAFALDALIIPMRPDEMSPAVKPH